MRPRIVLSAVVLAVASLAVLPASGARADTTATLPLSGYYQMVVDSINDHLFFSQGSSAQDSILVTDFAGNTVATITGQTGVMGIALSPDGSTLYAALSGADAVSAISTSTLQQTALYQLPAGDTPSSVAVQSGKLWVSYGTGVAGDAAIGDFDLSATNPSFETQPAMGGATAGWYSAPLIAADPSDTGNVLVAIQTEMSPAEVASYDTAQDPVTVLAQTTELSGSSGTGDNCDNAEDLAVVPGGGQFIPACGAPYDHYVYSTADLSEQDSYPTTDYPDAVAIASGTGLVAAGVDNPSAPDIYVFTPGSGTPVNEFSTGGSAELVDRGLALTSNGSELFAVTEEAGGYALNVYDSPGLVASSLTLSGPASADAGHAITLAGTLNAGDSTAGAGITVTRSGPGGTTTLTATTGPGGAYTLTDTPPGPGSYTYSASYAGDATTTPAAASLAVTVSLVAASLTVTATASTAVFGSTVHVTAHLGTTATNRTVTIYARPAGGDAIVALGQGAVNPAGNLTVSYTVARTTTFSAVFTGDSQYAPATVTVTVRVSAKVTTSIAGYYASKRVGSVTYRLYHHTAHLDVTAVVLPKTPGGCAEVEVDEYYRGAWDRDVLTGCIPLSWASSISGYLTLGEADVGYKYRLRVDYVPGSDSTDLGAGSPWQYFMVEK